MQIYLQFSCSELVRLDSELVRLSTYGAVANGDDDVETIEWHWLLNKHRNY